MSTFGRRLDARTPKRLPDHGRNAVARGEGFAWGDTAKEHPIGLLDSRPTVQIARQCVAEVLRKRQSHLVSSLPHHLQSAVCPVDVTEAQLSDISRAQAQSRQQQQDRAVSKTPGSRALAGSDETVQFLRRETVR